MMGDRHKSECYGEADRLRERFAALPYDADRVAVFAYLAGRVPEHAAEALRLNEPAPTLINAGLDCGDCGCGLGLHNLAGTWCNFHKSACSTDAQPVPRMIAGTEPRAARG